MLKVCRELDGKEPLVYDFEDTSDGSMATGIFLPEDIDSDYDPPERARIATDHDLFTGTQLPEGVDYHIYDEDEESSLGEDSVALPYFEAEFHDNHSTSQKAYGELTALMKDHWDELQPGKGGAVKLVDRPEVPGLGKDTKAVEIESPYPKGLSNSAGIGTSYDEIQ